MEAEQTGVTEGNAALQASTVVPRSAIAASTGARPVAIARRSIAGCRPSMTASTSLRALSGGS
jgi:hypothetical protein